mmetsp:Transcript_1346/g.2979  ORF Transcript_1346/g.2979 Transcript_1346/m.2979 type:complete len:764 (+) Transcript_1346:193-2484(+)
MRIFGKHASLVAVLLTLSPAHGDLRLGGRAKKTGEGLDLDAPNGRSSEGLAVLKKTVFRGGRENSRRRQTGRGDAYGDGGADSVGHLNPEGKDVGLGLGIMDGGNDSEEEANSTLVSNEVSEGSAKHHCGGVRGQNNHEPTSKNVELSDTILRGGSVSSSENISAARDDGITGEDITASIDFSAEGVYTEESLSGIVEIERNLGLFSSKNQILQFNESSFVNPMNDKYAHIYDLYEMEDNLQLQEEETGNGKYKDHDKNKDKYAIEKAVIIEARSRATPAHSETNEAYSIQGKPICGRNAKNPTSCKRKSEGPKQKKKKDPSYVHSTTFEEIMEKFHEHLDREAASVPHGHGRELRLRFPRPTITASEAGTLGDALGAVGGGGGLETGLDILGSTVVTSLCSIGMWAAAGATMGMSIALAPIVCAASGFWSGLIFSSFSWIGDTGADDAWWTVEAANSNYADGNSLNIGYHRGGSTDTDGLGWIDRGEVKSSREDLDARTVDAIEVYIDDVNDVCVKNMQFQLGREPSGTGVVEKISITAPVFASITRSSLRSNGSGGQMCLYFGDAEGAIGNFKFHWPSALVCHKNFGSYLTPDYANCLSWAMYSFDKRVNGRYRRWTYSYSPSLPSYYSDPFQMVKNRGTNLCFDTENYKVNNYNPVNLVNCRDNDAQRFDFDGDGRIRSIIDPTKCIEAGSAGTLYRGLYIYDCHGGDWQRWSRWSDGRIRNVHHGKFIGMSYCRRASGTRLELRWYEDGACGDAQKWAW